MLKSLPVDGPVPGDPCSLAPWPWIAGPLSANWPFPGRPDGRKHTQALGLHDGDAAVFFIPALALPPGFLGVRLLLQARGVCLARAFSVLSGGQKRTTWNLKVGQAPRPLRSGVRVVQAGLGQRSGGAPADPAWSPAGRILQLCFVSRARARRLWGRGLLGPRSHIPGGSGVPFSPPPPQCSCS